tara:strand:- start:2248 stop:3933 length:1686 start_codon:yes stop_codon:yes gene_type:complete
MAVRRIFPRRQEDPLIQQLLQRARQEYAQSSAIGSPQMYQAAAGGGIGPVAGVLTAQVLAGARSRNALQAAQLKEEQANIADTKLTQALINRQVDGKIVGPRGQFFEATQSADEPLTESNLASALKQDMSGVEGFVTPIEQKIELFDIPATETEEARIGERKLPITLDQIPEEERFLYTGTQDVFTPATVDIPGTPKADNFFAKAANFLTGKQNVKDIKAADLFELASASGRSPLEVYNYLQAEEQKEEGKYQNISPVNVEKDGNIFPTKTAAFIVNGEIKQVLLNPETKTYELYENSDYKIVDDTKQTTKNRAQTTQDNMIKAVKAYIKNRNITLSDENIEAVAAQLTRGQVFTEQGDFIDKIGPTIKATLAKENITFADVDTKEKFNNAPVEIQSKITKQVNDLGENIAKSKVNGLANLVDELESLIPATGNIPGIGPYEGGLDPQSSTGKLILSDKAKNLRRVLQKVLNTELRIVSGAAVTDSEFMRTAKTIPVGFLSTEKQFREAIISLRKSLNNDIKTMYAGFPVNIQKLYINRPNSVKPSNFNMDQYLLDKYNIQ